jgi:hypothetical protein
MHCEYVAVTNCVLSTGICAFRIGVGFGTIRHARISNIVIKQSNTIVQFCTAFGDKGKANIEDVNFSNISAANTNRCLQGFANNGAYIKNITMENIRTTSTIQNYVERNDGVVENIVLRNVELDYHDAATALSAQELAYRGDKLLYLKGADNVTLENVKINGSLYGVEKPVVITDCNGLVKKDCNF